MQEEKASVNTVLMIGGSLILFFSATISQNLALENRNAMIWAFVSGTIFITAGLFFVKNEKAFNWFKNKLADPANWLNILPWQILLLIISPLFAILAVTASGFGARMHSPFAAVATWMLGIACAICGSWQWTYEKPQTSRITIYWFVFVTMFAFLLRALATDQIPILLTGDEGSAGINAAEFANGGWNNIFITSWFSFPSLFPFIQSLSIRIFGQTIEALRIPSALAGALTVGAVYLCGKEMFGPRAGLFAALFLSTLHFHIHFSRLGINNIWDGLGFTITIGALWYGWKNNHRGAYLLAGLALGFSQYFYSSGRALIIVIFILAILIILFQRARILETLPHFLKTVLTATVVIAPLAWFYINEPHQFMAPIARVSILKGDLSIQSLLLNLSAWKILLHQLAIGMEAYTYTPILFWYAPDAPILRPIPVVLFYIGFLYLIIENRDSRLLLLSLWLIAFGIIGGLSDSAPASQRYVASAPACALIVGYGLHKFGNTLENLWSRSARVITVLVFIVLGMTMISELYFYFIEYTSLSRIDNMNSNGIIAQELANYLKDKPQDVTVAFLGTSNMGYYSIPSTQYLLPHITGIEVPAPWKSFDRSKLTGSQLIFIFLPQRQDEVEAVMKQYPNGKLEDKRAWNNQIIFQAYDLSAK
jgi:4-amino-4-deoxy-L-arabinose transferase-like glycosyltransferase